jgi:glutathione synthase
MINKPKIAVVMDPISNIKPAKDTTLSLLLAATELDAQLFYLEQDDLYLRDDQVFGSAGMLSVFDDDKSWFTLSGSKDEISLSDMDLVMMRKDPPVDKRFIHSCYMLSHARRAGVNVVNDPDAMVLYNEKLLATHFPEFCPPYLVSASLGALEEFLSVHEKIIIKPLDAMGGRGVFLVEKGDVNFEVIWETHTSYGVYPVIAQRFVPEISKGDSRILIINGKPVNHALVRLPKEGSVRGNLAAGGSYDIRPLNPREQEISDKVAPVMKKMGIILAGIDVIGDYLIEVNITSPTGIREISKSINENLSARVITGALMRAG